MLKDYFVPTKKNKKKPYLLRKIAVVAYTILLLIVNYAGGILGIEQAYASTISPANVIALTNQERQAAGLPALSNNAQLASAALAKANDMFAKQYWDHFGPNGETPWQFIKAAGYNYVYAGENLGKGFRTTEGLVEAWMASPTHRDNILSPNYKDIGIAVVEGVLLDKQTILVVQMFGNLTSSVQGSTAPTPAPTPAPEPTPKPTTPKVVTGTERVITPKEQGEIRSIRITSPAMGETVTDPSINIKGETTNTSGEYTVGILENNELVGSTTASGNNWEFSKDSDWSEGEHKIIANIQGSDVKSEESSFIVDSKPPLVVKESVKVHRLVNEYKLSFDIEGDWVKADVIVGSDILPITGFDDKESVSINIPKEKDTTFVEIIVSDNVGNSSTLDISEYFQEEEKETLKIIPTMGLSVKDGINIGLVLFVFVLLCVQIVWYIRKGKIKEATGDIFTVGVWWLVIAVAIFNGFSGVIT